MLSPLITTKHEHKILAEVDTIFISNVAFNYFQKLDAAFDTL